MESIDTAGSFPGRGIMRCDALSESVKMSAGEVAEADTEPRATAAAAIIILRNNIIEDDEW
jgi:hypothetical protein